MFFFLCGSLGPVNPILRALDVFKKKINIFCEAPLTIFSSHNKDSTLDF